MVSSDRPKVRPTLTWRRHGIARVAAESGTDQPSIEGDRASIVEYDYNTTQSRLHGLGWSISAFWCVDRSPTVELNPGASRLVAPWGHRAPRFRLPRDRVYRGQNGALRR